jgi:hypothetical protein
VAKLPALASLCGLLITQVDPGIVVEVDDLAVTNTLRVHLSRVERGDLVRGKNDARALT